MEEASTQTIKKNLQELKKLGVYIINFTGGEPLIREDLPEILRFSKRLGFFNILTTNCVLYPEKAKQITGFVDHLVFSLDSHLAKEHDRIRGVGCFNSVIVSINIAKKLRKNPIINFTMTRDSVQELPNMVDLCQKLGVLLWINPVYNWSGLEGFNKDTIDYISRYFGRKKVAFNLASLNVLRDGGNNIRKPVCRAGNAIVTIFPDNTLVSPCFYLQKASVKINGDLADVFREKEVQKAASLHGKDERCKKCMDWSYINPSFFGALNRNFFLALYSIWSLFLKESSLRKETKI
jgi:MoaA/NifB/PqqE/SkfB family radical SAM enzyme